MTCEPTIRAVDATGSVTQVGKSPDASGLFQHPITYLAPGQTLAALFGHYSGIKVLYPHLSFKITLQYDGEDRSYTDTFELSLKSTDDAAHLADYDIGAELHAISETLEKIRAKLEVKLDVMESTGRPQ